MPWPKGREFSEEHRRKISIANTGKRHSEETRRKLSEAKRGKPRPDLVGKPFPGPQFRGFGADHPAWKGDAASYSAIHAWMRRNYPKTGQCEECGRETYTEWANIGHAYRRVREDWRELCFVCHRGIDYRYLKWRIFGKGRVGTWSPGLPED